MSTYLVAPRLAVLVCGAILIGGLVGGCASSRLVKNPQPSTQTGVGWAASAPDGISVEVRQLIFRNSGGSWIRDANWDEYVLTIRNDSQDAYEIQSIDLVSDKLPAPVGSTSSRMQLEARSNHNLETLKDAGIIAGVGIVGPSALIVGAIGTSGGLLSAGSGASALAAIGFVAIPIGLIGGTAYVVSRHRRDAADRILVDRRLGERGYDIPLQIAAQAEVTKSAFFPITPAPTHLVLSYSFGGIDRSLSLSLPGLTGLHLKAPRTSGPKVSGTPTAAL